MRWVITVSASKMDVERLLAASIEDLALHPTEPRALLLELEDPFGDQSTDDTRQAIRQDVDLRVRHINGFGKLRWGRGFEGVMVGGVRSIDSTGSETQVVWVDPAYDHMQPREYADMVEKLGHTRPALPTGLEVVEALDGAPLRSSPSRTRWSVESRTSWN